MSYFHCSTRAAAFTCDRHADNMNFRLTTQLTVEQLEVAIIYIEVGTECWNNTLIQVAQREA